MASESTGGMVEASDTATYHPVTLGELHAGVERAENDAERGMRRSTLRFTAQRLEAVEDHVLAAAQFGFLTARFLPKLSHNDDWIVATAFASPDLTVVTEDRNLFGVVASDAFALAMSKRGWVRPNCRLVESTAIAAEA